MQQGSRRDLERSASSQRSTHRTHVHGPRAWIVVYGATGRSGRRVCQALLERGERVILVGRDQAKLHQLAQELGGEHQVAAATLDDCERLREVFGRGRVVVNCAGPFTTHGRRVQDAALSVGCHCLDMSGEHVFVRATLARDAEARAAGVLLMSGAGFDVVPTDALAVLMAEQLGGSVESVRVAYSALDAGPTRGIAETMLLGLLEGGAAVESGALRHEALGHARWTVDFPAPLGRIKCASVPWGDLSSLPKSTGARRVRTYLPKPALSPALARHVLLTLRALLPARWFAYAAGWLSRLMVRRLPLRENRATSVFAVVEVQGTTETRIAWLEASGEFATHAAALCASLAASPGFAGCGAQTPARAFGARSLLDELERGGLRWGISDGT